jgi:hypothetical protein
MILVISDKATRDNLLSKGINIMESIKHKIMSHLGSTGAVAIQFTEEEVKHLHDLLTHHEAKPAVVKK